MLRKLFIILLLEGFITISVEVITIRQLLPFYGGSVLITSLIIGVFLLFLALGYWRGGSYQQDFFKQLSRNFILSMVWIGVCLSYLFVAFFYYASSVLMGMPFLMSLFCYLLLALSPIVYWMGQTVPLTTNLFSQAQRVSHISGRALFLSTIGSFLGALLTSLLLFQYLGVAWTVFINCFLLFFLVSYLRPQSDLSVMSLMFLLIALVVIFNFNVISSRALFLESNNYGNYRVIEKKDFGKILQINQSNSSMISKDKKGFPYIEYFRDLLFKQLKLKNKTILVIGAGGFSLTAAGSEGNEVTYVDIDPAIKDIAERHFLNAPINGKFVGLDARQYLQQTNTQYDAIVSDVYSNQATIPPSLLTKEYFNALAHHLKPDGLLVINIIANSLFKDDYSRTVYDTIHTVFPFCAVVPMSFDKPASNIIYICPKTNNHKPTVYRDNLNTATTDFFRSNF